MRGLYVPILCLVLLRFGVLSLPDDGEELRNENDMDNVFPELDDYEDDGEAEAYSVATPCSEAGTYACQDCLTVTGVNANCEPEVVMTCPEGKACYFSKDAGVAYCADVSLTECSCGSTPTQCDPLAENNVLYCSTNGPFYSLPCETANNEVCRAGECVDSTGTVPTTVATPPTDYSCGDTFTGVVLESPTCQNAIFCRDGVQLGSSACETGEYYDPQLACQPAPPTSCDKNCVGFCPDKLDCKKFYVCDADGNALQHEDCAEGEYFNPNLVPSKCEVTTAPDYCPQTEACTAYTNSPDTTTQSMTPQVTTDPSNSVNPTSTVTSSTGTVTSPTGTVSNPTGTVSQSTDSGVTTTNSGVTTSTVDPTDISCNADTVGTYEYPPDCTMYVWCQETSPGNFDVIVRQCWGGLAYNPEIGGCDYPENVPDCNVKKHK